MYVNMGPLWEIERDPSLPRAKAMTTICGLLTMDEEVREP
jgi:hypothetical protein